MKKLLVICGLLSSITATSFTFSVNENLTNLESSDVKEDISSLDLENFNLTKNNLFYIAEDCYSTTFNTKYNLFFYYYHNDKIKLKTSDVQHVSLAVDYDINNKTFNQVKQYQIELVDVDEKQEFYKFKLKNLEDRKEIYNYQDNVNYIRNYYVSSITLTNMNDEQIRPNNTVGFKYTGFAKYLHDGNDESTLTVESTVNDCLIVDKSDLYHDYYRVYNNPSSTDYFVYTDLFQVGFLIPDYYLENYGEVTNVSYSFYQLTSPWLVLSPNTANYNKVKEYLSLYGGQVHSNQLLDNQILKGHWFTPKFVNLYKEDESNNEVIINYQSYDEFRNELDIEKVEDKYVQKYTGFNNDILSEMINSLTEYGYYYYQNELGNFEEDTEELLSPYYRKISFPYFFDMDNAYKYGEYEFVDNYKLKKFLIGDNWDGSFENIKYSYYPEEYSYDVEWVKEQGENQKYHPKMREVSISTFSDENKLVLGKDFDISGWHVFWNNITANSKRNEFDVVTELDGVKLFHKFDSNELTRLNYTSDDAINSFCNDYYVSKDMVLNLQTLSNKTSNKSLFLLNYSTGKFKGSRFNGAVVDYPNGMYTDNSAIVVQTDYILDFEFISFTFSKDGVDTIIPVINQPFNEFVDLQLGLEKDRWLDTIITIIMIVVAIILIILLWPIISNLIIGLIKIVISIFTLPFKLIKKSKKKK